jgi:hypothetical protein
VETNELMKTKGRGLDGGNYVSKDKSSEDYFLKISIQA